MTDQIAGLSALIGGIDKVIIKIRALNSAKDKKEAITEISGLLEKLEAGLRNSKRQEKKDALSRIATIKGDVAAGNFNTVLSRLAGVRAQLNRYLNIVFEQRARLELKLRQRGIFYLPINKYTPKVGTSDIVSRVNLGVMEPEFFWRAKVPKEARDYISRLITEGALGDDILAAIGRVEVDYTGDGTEEDWFLEEGRNKRLFKDDAGKPVYGPIPSPNLLFERLAAFSHSKKSGYFSSLWYAKDSKARFKNRKQLISVYKNYCEADILRGYVWRRNRQVYSITWKDKYGNRHGSRWVILKDPLRNIPIALIKQEQEKQASFALASNSALLGQVLEERGIEKLPKRSMHLNPGSIVERIRLFETESGMPFRKEFANWSCKNVKSIAQFAGRLRKADMLLETAGLSKEDRQYIIARF